MKKFQITRPDQTIRRALQDKIDNLTKPKGSLGRLEELALQLGLIQQTLTPELRHPHNILFAADHGILAEGVSPTPKDVTWQQCIHFVAGGAGISFLCKQHGFTLKVVDAGVDFDFPPTCGVIDRKIRRGTRSFLHEAAMTHDELSQAIEQGADIVREAFRAGCNVVSFGEMGAGNTSPSSLWMHLLTGIPLRECVGAGSGLDDAGVRRKYEILQRAIDNYRGDGSPEEIIRYFGGLEMVMAIGGMLQAAELKMTVLVDGFIMTSCMLAASKLYPETTEYAVYGHQGDEAGHRLLLEALGARPLLHLGLRLGEGSGAVCAYPILQSAVAMIRDMDSFFDASVTKYFD